MQSFKIFPLREKDLPKLLPFCDKEIGKNYFTSSSLHASWEKSFSQGLCCSFIAYSSTGVSEDEEEVVGLRLTYAPGTWIHEYTSGLSPELWQLEAGHLACFKSLFVDSRMQKQGLGRTLSTMAIEVLKKQGAQAILSHSSLQSPNNSSQKYLRSMGFRPVKEHPLFWNQIDYYCTHCGQRPSQCTSLEMILYL